MTDDFLLLNPGPVPLEQSVLDVMAEPMVSHRSASFEAEYSRASEGLRYVFEQSSLDGTQTAAGGTPLLLMGTATLGMEAAIANLVDESDIVVTLENGKFGRRFRRIAERYATVRPITAAWGESFSMDAIAGAISDDVDLVAMVHNETSTGLINPVEEVGELAAEHDAHFVVDGVTSIGGDEFRIADWNVDIAITDAQKALASPPGISAMYVADGVDAALAGSTAPFYADLPRHVQKASDNQTPFTSAIPLVRGMAVALEGIEEEGMPDRIARHRRQAQAFRAGFEAIGLSLFPEIAGPTELSNTVTAVALPDVVRSDPAAFFDAVADRNVSISGGQAHLGGKIFRVSNMGNLRDEAIIRGVETIAESMAVAGFSTDTDTGIAAAAEVLSQD